MIERIYIPFYFLSFLTIMIAFAFALFHSKNSGKKSERMYEFGRNALLQFSAMIFALATAQLVYIQTSKRQLDESRALRVIKENENIDKDRSLALSIISQRAVNITRAMRRLEYKNIPGLTPSCLDEIQPTEQDVVFLQYYNLDYSCLEEIKDKISSALKTRDQIEMPMTIITETMRVSDDWARSSYLSDQVGPEILQNFEAVEDKLDYRLYLIHLLFEKLLQHQHQVLPDNDDIRYLSYIDLALRNFQKKLVCLPYDNIRNFSQYV